jgi:hypothetical protein
VECWRERCLHDTAARLTQGAVEVVKRGVSVVDGMERVCDETVGVLEVSEECERLEGSAGGLSWAQLCECDKVPLPCGMPCSCPSNTTPPSLPASLSVAPCAFPAIAADGDPFGSLPISF